MARETKCLLLLILSLFFVSCAPTMNLTTYSYETADSLIGSAATILDKDTPLLIASFVDINNLEKSSALGRLLSEQVASKFVQEGYNVKEIKLSNENLFVKQGEGEFILSRRLKNIKTSFKTDYVIVGTYSAAAYAVYVSSRIVRISDSTILASHDMKIPGNKDLWELVDNSNGEK